MSYGGNAGGTGSDLDRFGDRMDLDVAAFWEIRNLGWGEKAARNASRSRLEQTRWRQLQQMDQVAADVAAAQAAVSARRDQLTIAQEAIAAAQDSYRRNSERIRDGQGLPIEVLQSIQSLDLARRRYTTLVADYNRSQFRLQRALGWPVDSIHTPPAHAHGCPGHQPAGTGRRSATKLCSHKAFAAAAACQLRTGAPVENARSLMSAARPGPGALVICF